jgi:hypothetical protein
MSDKTQTAVEWFMEQIGEKQSNGLFVIDTLEDVKNTFEQAIEMEKQQMIDMYEQGCIETYGVDEPSLSPSETDRNYGEAHYKQKFKS